MAKKRSTAYTARERKAEAELDTFLHRINNQSPIDILQALKDS